MFSHQNYKLSQVFFLTEEKHFADRVEISVSEPKKQILGIF